MDPTLIILAVVVVSVVFVAIACAITYTLVTRHLTARIGDLIAINDEQALAIAGLEAEAAELRRWVQESLVHLRDQRIEDLSTVAEKLHELTQPAALARLALPAAPRIDLAGDPLEDSGTSLFDALTGETGIVPQLHDLTMSTYTRAEAAELTELLHAGAGR